MDARTLLRQLLRNPSASRTLIATSMRPQCRHFSAISQTLPQARFLSAPRILQPSFWASIIPRSFRPSNLSPPTPTKEWNPATPYIILSLLVGSQAIQVLWLKRDRAHDMRRAEAKIGILREVIERVQKGEDVDVEKVLGTGVEGEEKEWAEILKEIEEEEILFQSQKRRKAAREAAKAKEEFAKEMEVKRPEQESRQEDGTVKVETYKGARFY